MKADNFNQQAIKAFQKKIWGYYKKNARTMPWRQTHDPYKILISEVMLQQTQVSRVIPKYQQFLEAFPDFSSLAEASLASILKVWQGLGYNRRALLLSQLAKEVIAAYHGKLPNTFSELESLPAIGNATAGAILAYAYNKPAVYIETNIRRVFIHSFFQNRKDVSDKEIVPIVEKSLDLKNPREWYYALMDYGAMLKSTVLNPNKRSKHYIKQSKFEGSNRQIRGSILKEILLSGPQTEAQIMKATRIDIIQIKTNIDALLAEGFLKRKMRTFYII